MDINDPNIGLEDKIAFIKQSMNSLQKRMEVWMSEAKRKKLFVSFSGGETSAYMTLWCIENLKAKYDEILVMFANTGQENEETLEFVEKFSKHFSIPVVWVEAEVNPLKGKGTRHRVVDFATADRNGRCFEDMIKKYGIPNQAYPHCTRELKLQPMTSYLRSIGWKKKDYDVAIGIRVDEMDRMSPSKDANNIIYPLIEYKEMTKPQINTFWKNQPFRLNLAGYQGNCKWCWKKSFRKHFTLMNESPEIYEFPSEMERKHGLAGANRDGTPRVFFRQNTSTLRLIQLKDEMDWKKAEDDSVVYDEYLDATAGCSDSCEIDFDDLGK